MTRRVTGLGGVFFKSGDPESLYQWYERHLGIRRDDPAAAIFRWRQAEEPGRPGSTVWSIFPANSTYFGPGPAGFMLNYRVENLDAVLDALEAEGVKVDERREKSEFGRFGWVTDPDGNRIELWEPPEGQ